MTVPDRPVDAAEIATDWGQAVHDYTFAPSGADLTTVTTRTVNTTVGGQHCHLDIANEDPGGYLDAPNDQAEIPVGGEGLYMGIVKLDSVGGTAGDFTRCYLYINGAQYASAIEENAGGTHIAVTVPWIEMLSAGDVLRVYAQKKGSGTDPTVFVNSFKLVRIGAEYGA